MSCLHLRDLSVRFATNHGRAAAVDRVSLDHREKETLALVGETGCGKSLVARAVLRLLPADAQVGGEIRLGSRSLLDLPEKEMVHIRGREIAIISQNPTQALNPLYPIGHQVGEMFRFHLNLSSAQIRGRVAELMRKMALPDPEERMRQFPFQFSEGMNQRVTIAAALALNPRILIADEPTKGLDNRVKEEILHVLQSVKTDHSSSLMLITHDLEAARRLTDRIAIMYGGEIVETAGTWDLFREPLHPYTRALLNSLPENGFLPIPGMSPSLVSPPPGCRFHPRCPFKMDRCVEERPQLDNHSGREVRCHLHN